MNLDSKPIENNDIDDVAVLSGEVKTFRTFADGTVRIIVEVDKPYRDIALHWFNETNVMVALARLKEKSCKDELLSE